MLNQDLNNKDSDVARANVTTGMALPGGAMIEQLARQRLLLYAEGQEWIGATIEYGDRNYRPVPFDNELEDALHLPEATAEYECVGSLLKKIAKAIECPAPLSPPTQCARPRLYFGLLGPRIPADDASAQRLRCSRH